MLTWIEEKNYDNSFGYGSSLWYKIAEIFFFNSCQYGYHLKELIKLRCFMCFWKKIRTVFSAKRPKTGYFMHKITPLNKNTDWIHFDGEPKIIYINELNIIFQKLFSFLSVILVKYRKCLQNKKKGPIYRSIICSSFRKSFSTEKKCKNIYIKMYVPLLWKVS
jgi:hypothetical protein